jgi:putative membrane protein
VTPEVQAFAAGFPITLMHAGLTLLLLILGVVVYSLLTPHREVQLIREGNQAAAVSFGGMLLGLAIPLAAVLAASPSMLEIVLWGAAVMAVQLLAFRVIDMLLKGLPQRIQEGEVAAAALLAAAKLGAAIILAAAVAG